MEKIVSMREYALRENLFPVLSYRPIAKKVYTEVLASLLPLANGDVVLLSFSDIEICDVSFADEFIINLQKYIMDIDNVLLCLTETSEDVYASIEATLMRRNQKDKSKTHLLVNSKNGYHIMGKIENSLESTFELLSVNKTLTTKDVVSKFGLDNNNAASNRLKKLYDARVALRKERIDENGREYQYYLP